MTKRSDVTENAITNKRLKEKAGELPAEVEAVFREFRTCEMSTLAKTGPRSPGLPCLSGGRKRDVSS